jgi:hypothetical protein
MARLAPAYPVSQRHEIIRRLFVLVRCECSVCGDEYHERRQLPFGETVETYVHQDGVCSKKCERLFRMWTTCSTRFPLRIFNAAWHISFHYWNRYGFPQC